MSQLKAFFEDKQVQKEWAAFIMETLNEEALLRVYAGKDTAALKEARNIIAKSFRRLNELFTPKRKPKPATRSV
jgi:hypothetical protein